MRVLAIKLLLEKSVLETTEPSFQHLLLQFFKAAVCKSGFTPALLILSQSFQLTLLAVRKGSILSFR